MVYLCKDSSRGRSRVNPEVASTAIRGLWVAPEAGPAQQPCDVAGICLISEGRPAGPHGGLEEGH